MNLTGRPAYFDWAACGTSAQYRKHLRHGIPPCGACLKAETRRTVDSHGRSQAGDTRPRRRPGCRRHGHEDGYLALKKTGTKAWRCRICARTYRALTYGDDPDN